MRSTRPPPTSAFKRVILVRGSGGNFSSGHDLGTPEQQAHRQSLGKPTALDYYDRFKKYNFDLVLKWRNCPKPTIAMVEGYCVYGGWMLAAAMDLVFAADDASSSWRRILLEYMSVPGGTSASAAPRSCASKAASSRRKKRPATAS